MPAHFYTYNSLNPSAVNTQPAAWHWEDPADWPRTYLYVSNQNGAQGIHPPAPVYQSNQPAQPTMYYFQASGSASAPAGYYVNGIYHGTSPPTASTAAAATSYQVPFAAAPIWSQSPGPAQAAAAVAANAALAAMPNAPAYFVGATAADIQAHNAILLANMQAAQQQPSQLVPFKPGQSPQFWCKELDSSWTLREYSDALKPDFPPGHWEKHATSGYHYYVRHAT
ncbi:hypothetical protein G647_03853 [Cladophialophora carrionii CBS 160.54]|uniref:WW domain-containing protein n=1 Tax=Cladophialophora carrionii CBS 160.54 TaxID=1279043 RepID=V9DC60_9EURO|nr:uncharacterized protein G647_03853 [Cladophialophora carrionii CBS 160.54]ETI24484.1 hypothetical protein G647_03853 [Cladophialophora carrionii CBS 160.54]